MGDESIHTGASSEVQAFLWLGGTCFPQPQVQNTGMRATISTPQPISEWRPLQPFLCLCLHELPALCISELIQMAAVLSNLIWSVVIGTSKPQCSHENSTCLYSWECLDYSDASLLTACFSSLIDITSSKFHFLLSFFFNSTYSLFMYLFIYWAVI